MAENSTACNSGVVKFSYSQNFEDVYIDRVFSDVSDGFYIDVGAYHPDDDSVTKYFYDKGWSGINIEPGPNFDTLATRTRDINLKIAISSKSGQEKFVFDQLAPGTSRIIHDTDTDADSEGVTVVDCMSLDELVHRYAPHRKIHFLKLDIEGEENAVILSTNWEVVRPELLVVESTIPFTNTRCDDGWRDHLMRSGYHDVFFDGINVYFLRTESLHRASDLNRPVNVLDNFVKFGAAEKEVGWLRERHRSNEAALANAHADYHWLKSQYDDTQAEAIWLTERREAADAALAAAQNDYLWLKSQTNDLQAEAIWQKERREAADAALAAAQNDYLWLKSQTDDLQAEAIWQKERREAADSALSALQNDYLWLKSQTDDLQAEAIWQKERREAADAALAALQNDYLWLKSQTDDLQAEAIWQKERREAADAALAAAQNDYLWLKSQHDGMQAEAIWQKERREAADSALSALQNDYLWLKSEYDIMLKEMNTLRDCRDNLKKSTFA